MTPAQSSELVSQFRPLKPLAQLQVARNAINAYAAISARVIRAIIVVCLTVAPAKPVCTLAVVFGDTIHTDATVLAGRRLTVVDVLVALRALVTIGAGTSKGRAPGNAFASVLTRLDQTRVDWRDEDTNEIDQNICFNKG